MEGEKEKDSIRQKSIMTGNGSRKLSTEFMSDSHGTEGNTVNKSLL